MRPMKDSGVEWIGKIPENWNVGRLKNIGETTIGLTYSPKDVVDSGILVLRSSNVQNGKISLLDNVYVSKSLKIPEKLFVKEGDILICSRNGSRKLIGKCAVIDKNIEECSFGAFMTIFRSKFNNYVYHIFNSDIFSFHIGTFLTSTINQLTNSNLNSIQIPLPPIPEQTHIASFLDKKCAAIDSAIEKQRASIDKLKEYRQAVITEAVTKGLNPDVPMKDSGVEWIGEIPEEWDVTKVSMLYNVILGKMLSNNPSDEFDSLENYLCAANLKWDGIRIDEVKRMWFSETEKSRYLLTKGDIVVTEGGDIGVSSEYLGEASPCYIQNAVHKVTAKDKSASNKLFYYWMCAVKNSGYLDLICNKATIAHYTKEKLCTTPVLAIPIKEQTEIAAYLDEKCSSIDETVSGKEKLIEKLEEYKKSLIYEAVTGKIEITA